MMSRAFYRFACVTSLGFSVVDEDLMAIGENGGASVVFFGGDVVAIRAVDSVPPPHFVLAWAESSSSCPLFGSFV